MCDYYQSLLDSNFSYCNKIEGQLKATAGHVCHRSAMSKTVRDSDIVTMDS